VVVASAARGVRVVPVARFLTGPKQNALLPDELIVALRLEPREMRQTFMKVGPRNAMVIAVVSLCLAIDREADEIRVAYGSAGPRPGFVRASLGSADELAELVARDASPIDDVRGTAAYRVHALKVLVGRALNRCLT
jgi:CO/xanthine dehydrogenase FAD-binding subunit